LPSNIGDKTDIIALILYG